MSNQRQAGRTVGEHPGKHYKKKRPLLFPHLASPTLPSFLWLPPRSFSLLSALAMRSSLALLVVALFAASFACFGHVHAAPATSQQVTQAKAILTGEQSFCQAYLKGQRPATVTTTATATTSTQLSTTSTITPTATVTDVTSTATQLNSVSITSTATASVTTTTTVATVTNADPTVTVFSTDAATTSTTDATSTVTQTLTTTFNTVSQHNTVITTTVGTTTLTSTSTVTVVPATPYTTVALPSPSMNKRDNASGINSLSSAKITALSIFANEIITDACLLLLYGSYTTSTSTVTSTSTLSNTPTSTATITGEWLRTGLRFTG